MSFRIRGVTLPIVLTSLRTKSAIFVVTFEIAAVACAATSGVATPRVAASSNAQLINLPTSSATRSRTVSRTAATTSPMIITPAEIPSASDPAPANASATSAEWTRLGGRGENCDANGHDADDQQDAHDAFHGKLHSKAHRCP